MKEALRQEILGMLSGPKLEHTIACEKAATELALKWGADTEKCVTAMLVHDITKKISDDEQLKLCEKYCIIIDDVEKAEPKILHGKTAAAVARDKFSICDEVYDAVSCHTTGKANMTDIDKITYLADYIEETRDFDGVETARELAFIDMDRALMYCFEQTLMTLIKRKRLIHKNSVEALNYLYFKELQKG